ncbi:hypothetical protein C1645_773910 [Glomus cerebriforme]|uniref:HMG box domain-containing protein n=1 Tax=Glomus cerebriforme TaxID=658196 RepID=A0A397SYA7_9GLOM|nr:hypothetical protein C1645_773910 [Glomus cerebriforme]
MSTNQKRESPEVDFASQVLSEKEKACSNLLNAFAKKINNHDMPSADDILQVQKDQKGQKGKNQKIKRAPNSNIIYTNQLAKAGLLEIIREFCNEKGINKQKLVPISKKVSKTLWNKLSEPNRKFFEELASEVASKHKELYPDYKYSPQRKERKETVYKPYEPKTSKTETIDSPVNDAPVHSFEFMEYTPVSSVSSQVDHEEAQFLNFETDEDSLPLTPSSFEQPPPTFDEAPPFPPLTSNFDLFPVYIVVF